MGLLILPLELVEYEQSETGKKLQYAKSAAGEKCKTKWLQRLKKHHEMVQYIKKSATRKKIQYQDCAIVKYDKGSFFDRPFNTGN